MSTTKPPPTEYSVIDLESQPYEDLPTYFDSKLPYPSNSTYSSPQNPSFYPSLNDSQNALLALAKEHSLTPSDIQSLASRPEFSLTPEEIARNRVHRKWMERFAMGFIAFWLASSVFIIWLGVRMSFEGGGRGEVRVERFGLGDGGV
jgi:hypothetical protein